MYTIPSLTIEKDVPIPSVAYGNVDARWPLAEMNIGDSFFLSKNIDNYYQINSALRCAASKTGRRMGRRYSCIKIENGVRCWRLE